MTRSEFKYLFVILLGAAFALTAGMRLETGILSKSIGNDKADDLKILAVMVDFEEDSLSYTTGNGKFNMEYPDTMLIDALPHDKEYFEDQLEFVKNYFAAQSGGAVSVSYTVLPDTLTVPHPIWYYNPNNGDEILAERLNELYTDSWSQIAQDPSVVFSGYNTFVIFHAGSGQEFNPGYDETPFDIPSVFLSSNDLEGKKITAHDGTIIDNSVILPECEWQIFDGDWYYAGMSGISCLMFAHRLGIPNMYSSATGQSCIGKFGLMDQGSANFSGLLPAGVTAWVKELKGWQAVSEITSPQDRLISKPDSVLYRLNLNSDEYLLFENITSVNMSLNENNSIKGFDRNGDSIRFYYNENGFQEIEVLSPSFKTLVRVEDDDFNFGVPARGILIWHTDKRKTTVYNIENNLINDDYDHRGVYIEEGDGSFDIGKDYWLLDNGYGTEYGWADDAFFSGNETWLEYANKDLQKVEFSSVSYPRADTNDGIKTGIKLYDFSPIGRKMYFSYNFEDTLSYKALDPKLGKSVYIPAYLTGEIRHYFAGTDGSYKIFDKDSLLFSGSYGEAVSADILLVQTGDHVITVSSDSTAVLSTDISNGTFQRNGVTGKIISQPVNRIIPTSAGILMINDDNTFDVINIDYTNAEKLAVLTDGDDQPVFIKGENEGNLFTVDLTQVPFAVETKALPQDSVNYSFIMTDMSRNMKEVKLFSYPEYDKSQRLSWTDFDHDKKYESITAEGGTLSMKNEYGIYENGFPLSTDLGHISKVFIFDGNIAVIDSSSNYSVISTKGDYENSDIRTISGSGNNSGLLKIESSIYLYDHSADGVLTYHKIGTGTFDDYLDMIKGVVELKDPIEGGFPTTIVSESVYNWPNPARGDETNFRFFLNFPCEVKIEIYDINGNKVDDIKQNFTSTGEYCELVWNVRKIPSGVYNAILSFKSASGEEKRKVKVAVIK
jgi:M6 family metalloprotease-like protein